MNSIELHRFPLQFSALATMDFDYLHTSGRDGSCFPFLCILSRPRTNGTCHGKLNSGSGSSWT